MELADLIEAARKHVITPEEHRAQVISFAYGNVAIENPLVTRELVESVYDRMLAEDPQRSDEGAMSGLISSAQHESDYLEIHRLYVERDKQYRELVDALCSPSWLLRDKHEAVVKLARRLRDSQEHIYAMDNGAEG